MSQVFPKSLLKANTYFWHGEIITWLFLLTSWFTLRAIYSPLPTKRPRSLNFLALKILVVALKRYGHLIIFQEIFRWSLNRWGCQYFLTKYSLKLVSIPKKLVYKMTVGVQNDIFRHICIQNFTSNMRTDPSFDMVAQLSSVRKIVGRLIDMVSK